LYKICPKERDWYSAFSSPPCRLDGDLRKAYVYQFKVGWTRNETVITYTRPNIQTAVSNALAYTGYIEISVTIVLVFLLRQGGLIKEIKAFTWGELADEQQDLEMLKSNTKEGIMAEITGKPLQERDPKALPAKASE